MTIISWRPWVSTFIFLIILRFLRNVRILFIRVLVVLVVFVTIIAMTHTTWTCMIVIVVWILWRIVVLLYWPFRQSSLPWAWWKSRTGLMTTLKMSFLYPIRIKRVLRRPMVHYFGQNMKKRIWFKMINLFKTKLFY